MQVKLKSVAEQLRASEKATLAASEKKDGKESRLAAAKAEHQKACKRIDVPGLPSKVSMSLQITCWIPLLLGGPSLAVHMGSI